MKVAILMFLIFCIPSNLPSFAEGSYFGQIINPDTFLYRDLSGYIICEIPQTYFVNITGYSKGYYTASYNGISGYVKSSEIKVIQGVPTNPYLTNATFRLFASDYNMLKNKPNLLSQDIISLPVNTPINYIGKTYGTELIQDRGNIWYYCSYKKNGKTYNGYIYAGLCDNLQLEYNTEKVNYIQNPFVTISSEYIEYLNSSGGKKIVTLPVIIIGLLFIPLLFLPLIVKKHKTKPSPILSIEDGKL